MQDGEEKCPVLNLDSIQCVDHLAQNVFHFFGNARSVEQSHRSRGVFQFETEFPADTEQERFIDAVLLQQSIQGVQQGFVEIAAEAAFGAEK